SLSVGEVDAEIVRGAPCFLHRFDRALCSMCALQGGEFFFYQRRCRSLTACLNASEQVALEVIFIVDKAFEVGILRVGLGDQIKQIKSTAGRGSQVSGNGRNDAPRGARD